MNDMNERSRGPTCRTCGKLLRKYMLRWWSAMPDGPRPVVGCASEHGIVLVLRPARTDSQAERVLDYWCGRWGHGGNGYFCSVRCGYFWAIRELEAKG